MSLGWRLARKPYSRPADCGSIPVPEFFFFFFNEEREIARAPQHLDATAEELRLKRRTTFFFFFKVIQEIITVMKTKKYDYDKL